LVFTTNCEAFNKSTFQFLRLESPTEVLYNNFVMESKYTKYTKNELANLIIQNFKLELVSVISHESALIKKEQDRSTKLLLIFNNTFNYQKFATSINTNKQLSKIFSKNVPLIFTEEELINSCDIFPIEFYEILAKSTVLFGKNLSDIIIINDSNLRLQIESNLRRNIILLRQEYFSQRKIRETLIQESINNVLSCVNNLLRIKDCYTAGLNARQILLKASEFLKIDVEAFFVIIRELETNVKKKKKEAVDWDILFHNYLKELQVLIREVDSLEI